MPKQLWGVDSAAKVTNELYTCTVKNYGKPNYWGRYLTTVPNVADGLTPAEIKFLHNHDTKILPIYNDFTRAVGYRKGRVAASNASFHARRLGAPKETFLFANIEKDFAVDEAFIRGWVDALFPTGYRPGIYADPTVAAFNKAYCTAVSKDARVSDQVVIWSQEPTPGPTRKNNAPAYKPKKPTCNANVWAWQYGENAKDCPIDTNLLEGRLFQGLW